MRGGIQLPATTVEAVEQVMSAVQDGQQERTELEKFCMFRDLCNSERRELEN